ncbi:DNA polymerase III subunit delta' [Mycolicibacterium hippocampi]|uniref:DNA polymerase III subunit delta' n=1 Tax=Mycolicibacterium hippocampi TaxID=659824 RepID=UPI001EEECC88|nr:DNA polymerase III subunit delta' [Mycolicibacterium hippocampi]
MTGVFSRLVGQDAVESELIAAARAARGDSAHSAPDDAPADAPGDETDAAAGSMTHAWLITGPPGSGRSVAALCFAAALQCTSGGRPGCGECRACTTTMAGTHADVRRIIPEGLSIGVDAMRNIVQIASRRPGTGRWQIVVVEDADRLTEGAANALLKVVEEPPPSTVFLLCAPSVDPEDIAITLRSRCRHIALVTPPVDAIARVLVESDGLPEADAAWAASVSGGHVGRARRLATDGQARERRLRALSLARTRPPVTGVRGRRGAGGHRGGRGQGADRGPQRVRGGRAAHGAGRRRHRKGHGRDHARRHRRDQDLERRQKSRQTRASRDALDRALIDLATYFRDALLVSSGVATVAPYHPDMAEKVAAMAAHAPPDKLLRCIEAVLECREALAVNVKPKFAVDAMVGTVGQALRG